MITDFLWTLLDHIDADGIWFQEDGAAAHTSRQTIAVLIEMFPNCKIFAQLKCGICRLWIIFYEDF